MPHIFDDITTDEYGTWTQVCNSCTQKHKLDTTHLAIGEGSGICGVEGCGEESDHYFDIA